MISIAHFYPLCFISFELAKSVFISFCFSWFHKILWKFWLHFVVRWLVLVVSDICRLSTSGRCRCGTTLTAILATIPHETNLIHGLACHDFSKPTIFATLSLLTNPAISWFLQSNGFACQRSIELIHTLRWHVYITLRLGQSTLCDSPHLPFRNLLSKDSSSPYLRTSIVPWVSRGNLIVFRRNYPKDLLSCLISVVWQLLRFYLFCH